MPLEKATLGAKIWHSHVYETTGYKACCNKNEITKSLNVIKAQHIPVLKSLLTIYFIYIDIINKVEDLIVCLFVTYMFRNYWTRDQGHRLYSN